MTWAQFFEHWGDVLADLLERYGVDGTDRTTMREHSWGWFERLVVRLLTLPPSYAYTPSGSVLVVQATRLGRALHPDRVDGAQKASQDPSAYE